MTVILGIPIPSQDPVFLGIVAFHVLAGLTAVLSGLLAMRLPKGRGQHSRVGTVYFWSLAAVFASMAALSIMRWAENRGLFVLGVIAFALALTGRVAARRHWSLRIHVSGMGLSYIVMLTAFYVDNGKSLPIWRDLPPVAFWIVPAVLGVPIILWAFPRHPLLRSKQATPQT